MKMFFKNLLFKPKAGDVYRRSHQSPWTEYVWVVNGVKDGWVRLVSFDGKEVSTDELDVFYENFRKVKNWSHK